MTKNRTILSFFLLVMLIFQACQRENEILETSPTKSLEFSTDSVFFDTLLTATPSLTKRLTVYNPNKKAVEISDISILNPKTPFTITVNGEKSTNFRNIRVLGEDSLRIFVETNIEKSSNELPFLVHDSLSFTVNQNDQFVNLIGWGQDANFLNGAILTQNTFWEGTKPYVIYGSLLVDSLATLLIEEGVQVYMSYESALYVKGSIKIFGTKDKPVIIKNIRDDEEYQNAIGQWVGIYLLEGSSGNEIENAEIKNGIFGLRVGSPDSDTIPDITLKNTIIQNMQTYGVIGFTSDIYAENCLINHCVEGAFAGIAGGNYTLQHCTLSNSGSRFFRESPTVTFSNFLAYEGDQLFNPEGISVKMKNCIIWGNLENEIQLLEGGERFFDSDFQYNILKTNLVFNEKNILNEDPVFKNPNESDFQLDTLSSAKDSGIFSEVKIDLVHQLRDEKPDIGAYERIE